MRILLADDDPEQRELICYLIKKESPDTVIFEAENGYEAIKVLEESATTGEMPDLIILDLNMPLLDGRNALVLIKAEEQFANIPVVIFTSSSAPIDRMFGKFNNTPLFVKSLEPQECRIGVANIMNWYRSTGKGVNT